MDIAVLIPTYKRPETCMRTIYLLSNYMKYSLGEVAFYIGDDSCDGKTKEVFTRLFGSEMLSRIKIFEHDKSLGLGANINFLINNTSEPYIMQMDDDHQLKAIINMDEHVQYLEDNETCGWIRLYGVGFHKYIARLDGHYWRISWHSPEVYITSMRPHIKKREWHDVFGMYPEGFRLGETEEKFCHLCKDIGKSLGGDDGNMDVAIPLKLDTETSWDHVGQSWQLKGK